MDSKMIGRKVKFDITVPNEKMKYSIKTIEKDVKGEIVAVSYSDKENTFFFLISVRRNIEDKCNKKPYFVTKDSRSCTLIG